MAFFNWSKKKEDTKQVEKNYSPEQIKPNFLDTLKETDFGFARIVNLSRYRGDGISCTIMINPQYIFPNSNTYQGFSPTMNSYGEGLLIADDVKSKISDILVEININKPMRYDYRSDYDWSKSDYVGYNDFYDNKTRGSLYYNRQAFANAVDRIVTQTKESFLTDNKIGFKSRISCDISVNDLNELKYQVSKITRGVKSIIEQEFIKEITKSKLIELKDKFFQQLSEDVMLDIFQHIIDMVPESKLVIGNESIKFHVPIIGKNSHKDLRVSFVLDDKVSNILYELGESSKRILGYCQNSHCDISFSQQGIVVKISPKINNEIIVDEELPDRNTAHYRARGLADSYPETQVRNHYTDWNL